MASLASIIYSKIYSEAFYVDFSGVVGVANMIASCFVGCVLMSVGYKLMVNWKGHRVVGWLNLAYVIISFASIAGVLGFNLPLDVEFPEMFPGLVIPMHFFPALAILSILPFFLPKNI